MPRRRFLNHVWLPALVFAAALAASAAGANRLKLWEIVNSQCVAAALKGDALTPPCVAVDLKGGESRGDVIIKDRVGVAQLLALPSARLTGIEDPLLLRADAPNYFAAAWAARGEMRHYLAHAPARDGLSIAVNSEVSRTQDQLHLHIDCLAADVARALTDYGPYFDAQWRPMTVALNGRKYWARRVDSADLVGIDPFHILADEMPGAGGEMGLWSLAAVPSQVDGKPGFLLLADHAELAAGGHSEDLQDHHCTLARP